MSDPDLDELREELKEFAAPEKKGGRPPREERIIAGFEDIQRFVERHGRPPRHGEDKDIFERLYAVRLDRLRALEECRTLLAPFDRQGLLAGAAETGPASAEAVDDDALRAELEGAAEASDVTTLRHVRPKAEVKAAEDVARREKCKDFERFKPLFKQAEAELKSGVRRTLPFEENARVAKGDFFILGGQVVYVAEMGEEYRTPNGEPNARLRVIYDNGTESDLLLRSLQRALYKDAAGRRLTSPDAGPLFGGLPAEDDAESGTIYVLRSKSEHPVVKKHREILHKIGVTGGSVEQRIANAELDATFLLAPVEVVATYQLFNINRTKLENLIHRLFAPARLEIEIKDRFGHPVTPREWFLVPRFVVDEAVEHIKDGTMLQYVYDPQQARLVPQAGAGT